MNNIHKVFRCAIYTRKSTEHNLDLAFNSLDAQREACEAYIRSQAHEGWCPLPDTYDDGGLSGASLERPALRRLLADVRSGGVNIIVVYKVDRLTRSLADFAKLVETFDAHGASFVSVTQSFNTTSSMGRLTLNVLLSFAQFEREVIGERVRDKIAASKRKGLWVGGPVPLGYRPVDKKLVVVPDEATIVRLMFERYLALRSLRALADELAERGIAPRSKPGSGIEGEVGPASRGRFMVGPLAHILKNRCYVGEVSYRGEIHPGQHEPIIEREQFEAVQSCLREGAVRHERARIHGGTTAPLMGLLFDERGDRMSPSHATKQGVRYRYYVSQALLHSAERRTGTIGRVSAPEVEQLVVKAVRDVCAIQPNADDALSDRELLIGMVERVILYHERIEVSLRAITARDGGVTGVDDRDDGSGTSSPAGQQSDARSSDLPDVLLIPWRKSGQRARRGIASEPERAVSLDPRTRETLLLAIARARRWMAEIMNGDEITFATIADREGKGERHVRLLAPLAFVSPRVIAAIIDGAIQGEVTVTSLARGLPLSWADQERALGVR